MIKLFRWFLSLFNWKPKVIVVKPVLEVEICTLKPDLKLPMRARRRPKQTTTTTTTTTTTQVPTNTTTLVPGETTTIAPTTTTTTTTQAPTAGNRVMLFFDFNGGFSQTSGWNGGRRIDYAASTLSSADRQQAIMVAEAGYSKYNVIITNNLDLFNAHTGLKQKIIVTPTSAWYTNTGYTGVAFIGGLGGSEPAWVFEDRLGYRWDYVGDIMVHESGHTLGLRHQSQYDQACALVASYKQGCHMGYPYNLDAQWVYGTTYTCTTYQDDDAILTQKLGLK